MSTRSHLFLKVITPLALWGSEGARRLTKRQSALSGRSRPLLRRAARVGGEASRLLTCAAALFLALSLHAQTNLTGRVYHHPNIMADEINKLIQDGNKDLDKAKKEAVAKAEKEKGRKLTAAELKEVDEKVAEAMKIMEAMRKGLKTEITATFKTDQDMVMKIDMRISEEALKAAGVGWAKRKAIRAALAVAPSTEKAKYVVKDNLVIINDGEETDTLTLSPDGKYLSGAMDEKTLFKLTRIK